jgi:serine/threonine protein kinase
MVITAGHILWSDLDEMPPCTFGPATALGSPTLRLAPDGQAFLAAALTKDPATRPSAEQLLQHPWLERHAAGRPWIDPVKPQVGFWWDYFA